MRLCKSLMFIIVTAAILLLVGCSGSTRSTVYYESYYDPYPYWGHGDDTTIIIDRPDIRERPTKPPGVKPPGDNRPKPPKPSRPSPKRR